MPVRTEKQTERLKRRLYQTRDCGTCNVCCTLLSIPELNKPAGKPCQHLAKEGKGCGTYATRPESCEVWACVWRSGSNVVEPSERPDRTGIMLDTMRPVPGKAEARGILVYETEPGGFAKADAIIQRLAAKWPVVLMSDPRKLIGPVDEVEAFLRDVPEGERP